MVIAVLWFIVAWPVYNKALEATLIHTAEVSRGKEYHEGRIIEPCRHIGFDRDAFSANDCKFILACTWEIRVYLISSSHDCFWNLVGALHMASAHEPFKDCWADVAATMKIFMKQFQRASSDIYRSFITTFLCRHISFTK